MEMENIDINPQRTGQGDLGPPVLLHCCGNIALDAEGFPDLCEGSELVVWDGLRLANSKT